MTLDAECRYFEYLWAELNSGVYIQFFFASAMFASKAGHDAAFE